MEAGPINPNILVTNSILTALFKVTIDLHGPILSKIIFYFKFKTSRLQDKNELYIIYKNVFFKTSQ